MYLCRRLPFSLKLPILLYNNNEAVVIYYTSFVSQQANYKGILLKTNQIIFHSHYTPIVSSIEIYRNLVMYDMENLCNVPFYENKWWKKTIFLRKP